jgi:hypothetical protein
MKPKLHPKLPNFDFGQRLPGRGNLASLAWPGVLLVSLVQAFSSGFTNGNPMLTPRVLHTATLLPNGKVLVAGGIITNQPALRTPAAELFDPVKGGWTATAPMAFARINHTATLLPNGTVLVAGGEGEQGAAPSAEIFEPATCTWKKTSPPTMARNLASATLLPNGKVLVAGGDSKGTTELYDPLKHIWTSAHKMKDVRMPQPAVLLCDGQVLAAGGSEKFGNVWASTELYTPTRGTWVTPGPFNQVSWGHTATLLPNGQVLVVGGGQPGPSVATAELFDPGTMRWSVLISTNADANGLSSAKLFEPMSGKWSEAGNLAEPRCQPTATLLTNGQVLIAGGWGTNGVLASVELYLPPGSASATTGQLAAQPFHIPTQPPGKSAPKEETEFERVGSNAHSEISERKRRIEDKWDEMRASAIEPGYKGHPLSYWISHVQLESSMMPQPLTPESAEAIAHIGTNAIPFLLKWMGASSSSGSSFMDSGTIQAFRLLGPDARAAIPELARLATNQPESILRAHEHEQRVVTLFGASPLMALGAIGPDALPALISILKNASAPGTRLGVIQAIGGMGTNAAPAVSILLPYLDDENEMVTSAVVSALGTTAPGKPEVLAALEKIALGSKHGLRASALEALSHFGEQAVPALIRALRESDSNGNASIAFHMLAFSVPTAITNSGVLAIAAEALQSKDEERREWAAYVLRAIDQQASGTKPDFMMPISRQDMRFVDATNILRRLAPQLLGKKSPK